MDETAALEFIVERNYDGWTVADYVAEKLKRPLPEGVLARALLSGQTPSTLVTPGMRLVLRKRSSGDSGAPPEVPVIFEDDHLLVVDKPAGLALHPTARYFTTTLTNALQTRHRNARGEKPDPAHRIDRETSGLVACGRTPRATRTLKLFFQRRQVEKAYLALVEGAPAEERFEIDVPLRLEGGRIRVKMAAASDGAPSRTACAVVARHVDGDGAKVTLLRCVPLTGRQHQIRAHLAAAGFPLVGDKLYGPSEEIFLRLAESGGRPAPAGEFDPRITPDERRRLRLWRHALHAAELAFAHPDTGAPLRFVSPLPADLQALIATLRPA